MIENNIINGKPLHYYKNQSDGVIRSVSIGELILVNCANFTVSNIDLSFTDVGIELVWSSNNTIANCRVYNNYWFGIYVYDSPNSTITNCRVYNNSWDGIYVYDSPNSTITNCRVYNNGYGIYLKEASNNEIHNSNIYNNTKYGVYNEDTTSKYEVNATYNWWGSSDGPGGVGLGDGDEVSKNVLYAPWWLIEPLDVTPPSVLSTQPTDGAVNVPVDVAIVITFSEPMNATTIPGNITITPGIQIKSHDWKNNNMTVTLTLASNLQSYTKYTITITTNVTDDKQIEDSKGGMHYTGTGGNHLSEVYQLSFRTEDVTPPHANAGLDKEVDEDTAVELNASLSSDNVGIVNWTWSFVDQGKKVFSYGKIVNYTFSQPGDYEITLNVSDAADNWAVDIVNIRIKDVTPPQISKASVNPQTQAQGSEVNITCSVSENVGVSKVKVAITGPEGLKPINTTMRRSTESHYYYNSTYSIPGNYTFYIWATDTSGNKNTSPQYNFTIRIKIEKTIEGREINAAGSGEGEVNIVPEKMPKSTPKNLQSITCINCTITGSLTYMNITIRYADEDVAGIKESTLKMYYWDETEGEWKSCERTGVDTVNNTVWANATHLTIFAPMGKVVEKAPLPYWALYLGIVAFIIILAVSFVIVKKRKKLKE